MDFELNVLLLGLLSMFGLLPDVSFCVAARKLRIKSSDKSGADFRKQCFMTVKEPVSFW